jgi:CRISPR-associated protein Cas2
MAKKKKPISFVEKMKKFSRAGIVGSKSPNRTTGNLEDLKTLEERLQFLLNIVKQPKRPSHYMLFFVMYDIESNRVRNQIVKYLIRTGCTRVQKSIFLADLPIAVYDEIRTNLTEVQQCYDNEDSILIVPISTDYLRSMKVIGQTLDVDLILKTKNTLFF